MADKVTFDLPNRLIIGVAGEIVAGELVLDFAKDVYSLAKTKWQSDDAFTRHPFPFREIGGDPLGNNQFAPDFYFLQNGTLDIFGQSAGWRFQPAEVDHTVLINGNFVAEDVLAAVFIPTTGDFTVLIRADVFLAQVIQVAGGLTAGESARLTKIDQVLTNERRTNPNTGVLEILDDNSVGILLSGDVFEDIGETQPYRGRGAEVVKKLT